MTAVINQSECIACEACVDVCPMEIIKVDEVASLTDESACTDCGSCVDACSVDAITV